MNRRLDIEAARLLAAFGIVWFHVQAPGLAWAYGGLVFFITLGAWLGQSGPPPRAQALLGGWRTRAGRLLLPWLLWTAVYGAVNASLGLPFWPPAPSPGLAVLAGPSIHLWYLPFVFAALALADGLRLVLPPPPLRRLVGLAVLLLAAWPVAWRRHSLQAPYPLLQWADGALPLLHGLLLAQWPRADARPASGAPAPSTSGVGAPAVGEVRHGAWWAASAPALAAAAWALGGDGGYGPALLLGGSAAAALARAPAAWCDALRRFEGQRPRTAATLRWAAAQTFGTYLAHSLMHGLLLRHTDLQGAPLAVAVFGLAFGGVAVLRAAAPGWRQRWS